MLKERFPFLEEIKVPGGDPWFVVPADKLFDVAQTLRNELGFDCLSSLTGTDRGGALETVYHIFSYRTKQTVVLKINAGNDIPSVSSVWPSANWFEREVFDLLGINFTGHPNLKRIMLPDDWIGHPLRKDYTEPAEYMGMSTTR